MTELENREYEEYEGPLFKILSNGEIMLAVQGSSNSYGTCHSGNWPGDCHSSHSCLNHGIGSACHTSHVYNWPKTTSVPQDEESETETEKA